MNFDQAFDKLIGHEGGYSNHPSDPGGETMFGVTLRVARRYGYAGAMKDLPRETAKSIYRSEYWYPVKADQLPENIRYDVFDAAVNSGVSQAAKWLQRAVGVKDDGSIGAQTVAAALMAGPTLPAKYNGTRLLFMTDLAGWPNFSKGWARRIASNLLGA